jgi:hypothetical protein
MLLWLTALVSATTLGVAIFISSILIDRGSTLREIQASLERIEHGQQTVDE